MLLVLRNGIRGGPGAAWATGLGCGTGIAVHATLAVLGLSAILAASDEAFTVVKIAGAAYLVWLGLNALIRPRGLVEREPEQLRGPAYRQGLFTKLLNPKISLLFLTPL